MPFSSFSTASDAHTANGGSDRRNRDRGLIGEGAVAGEHERGSSAHPPKVKGRGRGRPLNRHTPKTQGPSTPQIIALR